MLNIKHDIYTPPKATTTTPIIHSKPTSILNDTKHIITQSRTIQNYFVSTINPLTARFANVLLPLAQAENALSAESLILSFYKEVSPDPLLREASGTAQKLLDDFAIESSMREDVFVLIDAVSQLNEELDGESRHFLVKKHREYIRNGLQLPVLERERFKEIQKGISELKRKYKQNLVEENGGIWFSIQELDGIPENLLAGLERGEGENKDKLRLTFKDSHIYPAYRFARNAETRKRVLIAEGNRCNQNVPLFKEVVVLRDEAARLLGYGSHAALRLEDKMAKTPEAVTDFLKDLRERLSVGCREEVERLKKLKEEDVVSREETFDEREYQVDQLRIAEYFSLETTIRGMLDIFQYLFGLVFHEIGTEERNETAPSENGNDLVWHEDVQVFSVWNDKDQGGEFAGYLYLDLYARKNKYGNAAEFMLIPGFLREDGTRQYPATALVCSFSKPTSTEPTLLIHREVVTLFHELGHGIHDLVSKTKFSRFHGTNTVIDFGEAPSQMLENWCWQPLPLKLLSRHYSSLSPEYFLAWKGQLEGNPPPPEKIPDEMIESLIGAKYVNGAVGTLRQIHMGTFDMSVHQPETHEEIKNMNISTRFNTLRKEIVPIDGPESLGLGYEWGHGQATFGHLMRDYDVGYYGYLSSQVYSADMFYSVFKKDPMNREEGLRYRYMVLEKGGSQDEMRTVTGFLGRQLEMEAFYRDLGLM